MDHLHDLVEDASTINSSTAGVDYNYDNGHEDDGAMLSLLALYPREFIRTPSNAISIFCADYKAREGCGQYVKISATGCQSVCKILAEG